MDLSLTINDLLKSSKSWAEFNSKLSIDELKPYAGKLFEHFAKYYFQAASAVRDDYKNVWLFDEIPLKVKKLLNLTSVEHGLDLLLEDNEGEFVAVQVKFRYDEKARLSWSKDKIANLFAYAEKANRKAVFTTASNIDEVSKSRNESFLFFSNVELYELTTDDFKAMYSASVGKKYEYKLLEPRSFQQGAINAVVKEFSKSDATQLILPCGAGKSLTSLWLSEKLSETTKDDHCVLVLTPSLNLVRQIMMKDWAPNKKHHYKQLTVCSDRSIERDSEQDNNVTQMYELGSKVTTHVDDVKTFIKKPGNKVIFSTYQSLNVIRDAVTNTKFKFNLVICDEAHKTAGSAKGSNFTLIHDRKAIPANNRLFMTATPRVLSRKLKEREDLEDFVVDMSNQQVYGKEAYSMSWRKAIDSKILVDYRIMVTAVTNQSLQEDIISRKFIRQEGTTVEDIANAYGLLRSMKDSGAKRAISFHSRCKSAENFANLVGSIDKKIKIFYIDGAMPTSLRAEIMREFANSEYALVANARCLTEGVDIPAIDLVYFSDPKSSLVDIVQASGRAMRKSKGKRMGYIVAPLFLHKDEDESAIEKKGPYKNVVAILRALSAYDEILKDQITNIRFSKGVRQVKRQPSGNLTLTENIVSFTNVDNIRFADEIFTKLLNRSNKGYSFDYYFDKLVEFKEKKGRWPKLGEDKKLAEWWGLQIQYYEIGSMLPIKIKKLESINFPFRSLYEISWETNLVESTQFKKEKGYWPREGQPNSLWVATQRGEFRKGRLSKDRVKKLEKHGFIWDVKQEEWFNRFDQLAEFKKVNNRWPEYSTEKELRSWMQNLKHNFYIGKLDSEKERMLKSIDFPFDKTGPQNKWEERFKELEKFVATHKRYPQRPEKNQQDNTLAQWLNNQVLAGVKNKLNAERKKRLLAIGVVFEPKQHRISWDDQYQTLEHFLEKNNTWPTKTDQPLCQWVQYQRLTFKKGKLSNSRIDKLNKLHINWAPGQSWGHVNK